MRIACSLAARRPEPPMRPMIRLGNLNARPSCPAAAPGSTVWVYLYAAGHRDMPGDSPAGNGRLSGTRAQDRKSPGRNQTPVPKKSRRPQGADRRHSVGQEISRQEPERHADSQGTHLCHQKPPRGTDGGQTAWGGNLHLHEPDPPEQHIFTGRTPETKKNRRPENRRRLDLRAAQAMR